MESTDRPATADLALIERMLLYRNQVCHEHALTVDHQHCIGCALVMQHMQANHPSMPYGSEDQWVEESAFCLAHERDIIGEFLRKEASGVRQG